MTNWEEVDVDSGYELGRTADDPSSEPMMANFVVTCMQYQTAMNK